LDASRSWENSSLESQTEVQLYPTIAYPVDRGSLWRIQVQGRICQNNAPSLAKRWMLKGLIRALQIDDSTSKSSLFHDRIHGFLVSPLARERIHVSIGNQMYVLPRKSKSSGLFQCRLDLPRGHLDPNGQCVIRWDNGIRPIASPVLLAGDTGVSVITDIDDTIKYTDVCSRRKMLRRTFAEPFIAIEGMPEIYQEWASRGAMFHYVSSSPWQIYDSLQDFLHASDFPIGSMHLKWFRLRDELIKKWLIIRRKSKFGVINNMVKRMPHRHFVLVGDSGEKDPEMYAKIASKYPKQVVRICIRQIDANPIDPPRLHQIYKRYGMIVPIQIYSNAKQLGSSPA
jgi:phosphatidate phosphatase APP1